jgi:hypothetical protein
MESSRSGIAPFRASPEVPSGKKLQHSSAHAFILRHIRLAVVFLLSLARQEYYCGSLGAWMVVSNIRGTPLSPH